MEDMLKATFFAAPYAQSGHFLLTNLLCEEYGSHY
jgi:hypothetical protein